MKLNLGCGGDYLEGYINIDKYAEKADERYEITSLPYENDTVDEIKAFHIIEHLDFHEGVAALKEWYRVLKPGGRLYIETPDFLESCREFVNSDEAGRVHLMGHFFSQNWLPGYVHKMLFTETQLRIELGWAGFKQINRLPAASKYLENYPPHIFLTLEAFK